MTISQSEMDANTHGLTYEQNKLDEVNKKIEELERVESERSTWVYFLLFFNKLFGLF